MESVYAMRARIQYVVIFLGIFLIAGSLSSNIIRASVPPLSASGVDGEPDVGPWASATVELSDSVGAATQLGDIVLTGYAANYTATENMAAVERDILFPVESLERDENFLPESHDSQYFVAWLESDETSWEPHSHLLNDAHALMWLKATESGVIGPDPGSVIREGQQYGFLATHGSIAMNPPAYLPEGKLTGEPFLELAGPIVTQTQGVSNTGASDLAGVVVSGFMGFSGGDYSVSENGEAHIFQDFTLPEIASRSGDNYAYTYGWMRPADTEVDVDITMDFETRSARAHVNVTSGYFKQARELPMENGFVQRYWGVVFSLYLYFYPPHQGADEGMTPRSRLLWSFEEDVTGELVAAGSDWEERWTDLKGGLGLELSGDEVVRMYAGAQGAEGDTGGHSGHSEGSGTESSEGTEDSGSGTERGEGTGDRGHGTGSGEGSGNAGDGIGDGEGDGEGSHLTGAGVLQYNLSTDYLGQGLVALTDIKPYGSNTSLVDAWGFSSLQIEGEDYPLTKDDLVDHSSITGVWVFGMSIGWIWVSPIIQNGGDPAVKSDSWWWVQSPGGSTVGLVFKVRDEVLVLARIMIRPMEGFADIVIEAGAYTLDGEEKEMKLWQHLDPTIQGDVTYTNIQRNEEFGPEPTGDGEDMVVTSADGQSVRWLAQDTGACFCLADSGEIESHPGQNTDGESITDQDVRFYLEHRNFGEEFYRAYEVRAHGQFRITWGGGAPVYDIALDVSDHPDEVDTDGTLSVNTEVTNNGDTPIACYVWLTLDGNPGPSGIVRLDPGESTEVILELDLDQLEQDGMNTTHQWTNFTLKGKHTVTVEAFPLGAEDSEPGNNVASFTIDVGGSDDDGFFGGGGSIMWMLLLLLIIAVIIVVVVVVKRRDEDVDYGDEGIGGEGEYGNRDDGYDPDEGYWDEDE
jgi:hypothetical protein